MHGNCIRQTSTRKLTRLTGPERSDRDSTFFLDEAGEDRPFFARNLCIGLPGAAQHSLSRLHQSTTADLQRCHLPSVPNARMPRCKAPVVIIRPCREWEGGSSAPRDPSLCRPSLLRGTDWPSLQRGGTVGRLSTQDRPGRKTPSGGAL